MPETTLIPSTAECQTEKPDSLTASELIEIGNPNASTDNFVREVGPLLRPDDANFNTALDKLGGSKIGGSFDYFTLGKEILDSPVRAYGILTCSVDYNPAKEALATAAVARFFRAKENLPDSSTRPLKLVIIPADIFYRYIPGNPSLVMKILEFQRETLTTDHNYALILTGFTQSSVFTESVVNSVPTADAAGLIGLDILTKRQPSEFQNRMDGLYRRTASVLESEKGDINSVVHKLVAESQGGAEQDARLLIATFLLSRDSANWQSLSEMDSGVGLFIVAPKSFHDAVLRVTRGQGDALNYQYRANRGGYGAHLKPLLGPETTLQTKPLSLSGDEFEEKMKPFFLV